MPFELTEFCTECNCTNIINYVKNTCGDEIIQLENNLHERGVGYLLDINIHFIIDDQEDYDKLDRYLREYKHEDYSVSLFTGDKIYYPRHQLECRIQNLLDFGEKE
jgi:hypothetical protein